MIEQLLSPEIIYALGWTLVHTLWQGALFALLLAVLLVVLRSYSAQARYMVAVGLLAGFFLTTLFTFTQVYSGADQVVSTQLQEKAGQEIIPQEIKTSDEAAASAVPADRLSQTATALTVPAKISFQDRMVQYYNTHLPLIVTIWLMGVLVLLLRMLGQLAYVQRLKSYGTSRFPSKWMDRLSELESRLDMKRPVQYLLSKRTYSPMTFGFLRPVVLFPSELIKDLEDTQIYAILAHELAHIKRDDFLVNLIQQFLMTLFFYHPGLWWMSARIEEEREHSCDDLAIRITEQPIGYAKTLIQIKENQMKQMSLSMSFAGTSIAARSGFQNRVSRLLSNSLSRATYGEGVITTLILVLALVVAVGATGPSPKNALLSVFQSKQTTPPLIDPKNEEAASNVIGFSGDSHSDVWGDTDQDFGTESDGEFDSGENHSLSGENPDGEKSDFDLFMEAVDDGNYKLVKYFLDKGADVNGISRHGVTPLILAASENHPEIISLLIEHGADVNFTNREGISAIAEAADEGAYAAAVVLLDAGANVTLLGRDNVNGRTAVALAASEGHLHILELLLDAGADAEGESGALQAAAEEGKLEIVRFLIEEGANINQQDEHGRTALSYAAEEDQQLVVDFLLEKGADPNLKDERDRTALDYAAGEDADQIVAQLMATKGGKDFVKNNPNLLIEAADEGSLAVVKQLVAAGADVNMRDEKGNTALMAAADEGEILVAEYLIQRGAKVNAANLGGAWMALHFAASEDETNMMLLLLRNGAKLEARCDYRSFSFNERNKGGKSVAYYEGASALLIAVEEDNTEAVKVLLENNAEPNIKLAKRRTILPSGFKWDDIKRYETEARFKELEPLYDTQSWTPLMEAVENNNYQMVDLLINAGAEVDAKTEKGMTALSLAQQLGFTQIINRLNEN